METGRFEALCAAALDPRNDRRRAAEQEFTALLKNAPEVFTPMAAAVAASSSNPHARTFALVMLRQYLKPAHSAQLWQRCGPAAQQELRAVLLRLLENEATPAMRHKVNECAAAVATHGGWADILPVLATLTQSQHAAHRESALAIYGQLVHMDEMQPHMGAVGQALAQALEGSDVTLHKAAHELFDALLESQETEQLGPYKPLIAPMFQAMANAVATDEDAAREMMQLESSMIGSDPAFFHGALADVVALLSAIARGAGLEPATRVQALTLLVETAAFGRGLARQTPGFVDTTISLMFEFMVVLEDEVDEWGRTADEDDWESDELFQMAVQAVDRLAFSFGGKLFFAKTMPQVEKMLASPDWRHRHAALMVIGEGAEGMAKQFKQGGVLGQMVNAVCRLATSDAHPRVRWAAYNTLAQLSADFKGKLHDEFSQVCVPTLCHGVADAHPRVQRHAVLSLVDYCDGADEEDLAPHLENTMQVLGGALGGDLKMQEAAVAAIAAVAAKIGEGFGTYYEQLMPLMMGLLDNAAAPDMLRARAMECVSFMGRAIGKESFLPHARVVMEALLRSGQTARADDETLAYLVRACTTVAHVLGRDFSPYAEHLVTPMLRMAARDDDAFLSDATFDHPKASEPGYESHELPGGSSKLVFNSSIVEERRVACDALYNYCVALEAAFAPYIQQTLEIMLPLVRYPYNEEMRRSAVVCLPALLDAAVAVLKEGGQDPAPAAQMFNTVFPRLMECLAIETNLGDMDVTLNALADLVRACPVPVPHASASEMHAFLLKQLNTFAKNRSARAREAGSQFHDEQEAQAFADREEQEAESLGYLTNVVMGLFANGGDSYLPLFRSELLPAYTRMLAPDMSAGERCAAICAYAEMVDKCPTLTADVVPQYLKFCMDHRLSEDADIRHAALYGVGVCAKAGGKAYAPHAEAVIKALIEVLQHESSTEEEMLPSVQNAISSIGKVIRYQEKAINAKSAVGVWLQIMPVPDDGDEEEAATCHALLLEMAREGNQAVLGGPTMAHLPRVMEILATVCDTDVATDETTAGIRAFWKAVADKVGPTAASELAAHLGPERMARLQKQ